MKQQQLLSGNVLIKLAKCFLITLTLSELVSPDLAIFPSCLAQTSRLMNNRYGEIESASPGRWDRNETMGLKKGVDTPGRNARDLNSYRNTADDQSLSGNEIKTLAAIRRRIVSDKNLSTYARKVKIIVDDTAVTLRGPVRDPIEAQTLVAFAFDTAPTLRVVDQLEIAPRR